MFTRWLRASHPARGRKQPGRRSFVPQLEALEHRDVPSTVLASGLEGSFGSTVGPDGNLYVTEARAGRISRVNPNTGQVTTFASGLPTGPYGGFGGGANDVAFINDTAYVLVALVGPDYGGGEDEVVGIYRVDGPDSFTVIADLGTWSKNNPPPTPFTDAVGVQYAMQPYRDGFLVTDGHHNRVLEVTLDGQINQLIQFDNIVPTGLEVRGNTAYVAQAGPVPHLPVNGKVVSFTPGSTAVTPVASGAPLLVDVEFGPGHTLYALSQGHWEGTFAGDPAAPNTGALVKVNGNGTFTTVEDGLDRPTSVEFIGTNAYLVTLAGEILKIAGAGAPPSGHDTDNDRPSSLSGASSLTVTGSTVTRNEATGGAGGAGGRDGRGVRGGVDNLGTFGFDVLTVIRKNHASTSDPDISGPYPTL
jgi:hypothetical protein